MAGTKADDKIAKLEHGLAATNRQLDNVIARTADNIARFAFQLSEFETEAKDEALPQRLDEHIKQVDQRFKDTDEFNQMRFYGHGMRLNELAAKVQAVSYGDELKGIYHRLCKIEDAQRCKDAESKGFEDEAAKQRSAAMLAEHNERCRIEMERLRRDIARPTPAYVSSLPQSSPCDFCEGFLVGLLVGGVIVGLVSYFLL